MTARSSATVIDLYSRRAGWAVADHLRTSLDTDALQMEREQRRPKGRVISMPTAEAQYASHEFARFCQTNRIRRSLGKTGICYEGH